MSRLRKAAAPLGWNALHLAGLNALVLARPYFEPFEKDPASLVDKGATGSVVVAFALIILLVLPAGLVLAELVVGLFSTRVQQGLHVACVAGFVALFVHNGLDELDLGGLVVAAASLAVAALVAALYLRSRAARSWFSLLGVAPLIVLALFLVVSPVRGMVFGGSGPSPVKAPSTGAPVVMVIFDELPLVSLLDAHGRVDRRLYPNFARLAATATWYRDAKTVGDHTTFAVPAIVTGRRPDGHRLPTAASHPDTLFRLLGGSYRLDVSSAFADLCSPAACPERTGPSSGYSLRRLLAISVGTFPVLPARVREELHGWLVPGAPAPAPRDRLTHSIRRQGLDVLAADDAQQVAGFLGALAPSSERTLNFAHLMTPHSPWVHLPSGQTYLGSNARGVRIRPEDPVVNAYGYRQHLSEVGYADHVLGQLIDRLKALGTFDESLIVVVADHGISFIPGEPDRDVTEENAGQIVGVPLLVKAPDQTRGETLDSPVETTDLVPTIAALLKTRIPWKVDGLPANRVAAGSRPDVVVSRDKGGRLTVSRARLTTLEGEALREKLRLFDDGNPFALGPLGGELGREVGIVTPAAQLHVTIANVAAYRDVAPRAAALPAEIRGTVAGDRPQRRPLAIAINGRVAATTESTVVGGREVFAALVPRFDAGNNLIRVLTEGPRSHRLTEIPYQR